MRGAHPTIPAQREAADWWLGEVRAAIAQAGSEKEARAAVVAAARRVSPTLLASAAYLLQVQVFAREHERLTPGLLAEITEKLMTEAGRAA